MKNEQRKAGIASCIMFVVAILALILTSCSVVEQFAADKADDVWKVLTTDDTGEKPIDSIRVRTEIYWVERIDTVYQGTEYRVRNGAVTAWYFETDSVRLNEMVSDTIVYFWRK